jgi:hypothetical protein
MRSRRPLGNPAYLLAASRSVPGYERVANIVDGEAYYWSSADPASPATKAKLNAFGKAVHAKGGLWFAAAASGYDGRTIGVYAGDRLGQQPNPGQEPGQCLRVLTQFGRGDQLERVVGL